MNISIETPHLSGQERFIESMKETMNKRYSNRNYIHSIKAKVSADDSEGYTVGFLFELIKGNQIYAYSQHPSLNKALSEAIQKADAQILKFKTKSIVYKKAKS